MNVVEKVLLVLAPTRCNIFISLSTQDGRYSNCVEEKNNYGNIFYS